MKSSEEIARLILEKVIKDHIICIGKRAEFIMADRFIEYVLKLLGDKDGIRARRKNRNGIRVGKRQA